MVVAAGSPHDYRNTPTGALFGDFKRPYRIAVIHQSDISERSRWMRPPGTRLSARTAVTYGNHRYSIKNVLIPERVARVVLYSSGVPPTL